MHKLECGNGTWALRLVDWGGTVRKPVRKVNFDFSVDRKFWFLEPKSNLANTPFLHFSLTRIPVLNSYSKNLLNNNSYSIYGEVEFKEPVASIYIRWI